MVFLEGKSQFIAFADFCGLHIPHVQFQATQLTELRRVGYSQLPWADANQFHYITDHFLPANSYFSFICIRKVFITCPFLLVTVMISPHLVSYLIVSKLPSYLLISFNPYNHPKKCKIIPIIQIEKLKFGGMQEFVRGPTGISEAFWLRPMAFPVYHSSPPVLNL